MWELHGIKERLRYQNRGVTSEFCLNLNVLIGKHHCILMERKLIIRMLCKFLTGI